MRAEGSHPPGESDSRASGIRVRLLAALVALAAGVAALLIAIILVRGVLA